MGTSTSWSLSSPLPTHPDPDPLLLPRMFLRLPLAAVRSPSSASCSSPELSGGYGEDAFRRRLSPPWLCRRLPGLATRGAPGNMPSWEVLMGGRAAGGWADALKGETAVAAVVPTGQEDELPFMWVAVPCKGSASPVRSSVYWRSGTVCHGFPSSWNVQPARVSAATTPR